MKSRVWVSQISVRCWSSSVFSDEVLRGESEVGWLLWSEDFKEERAQ